MKFRIYSSSFGATMLGILSGIFIAIGVLGALSGAVGLLVLAVAGVFIDIAADKLAKKKDLEKIKKNAKYAYDRFLQQKTPETKSAIIRMNPDIRERVRKELPTHWVCDRCLALNENAAGNRCRDCNSPIGYAAVVVPPATPAPLIRREATAATMTPTAEAPRYAPAETSGEPAAKSRLKSTMHRSQ